MKQTQYELVTRTYCDKCGRDVRKVGSTHYGMNGKNFCADHRPWSFQDIKRGCALREIKRQPFFAIQRSCQS